MIWAYDLCAKDVLLGFLLDMEVCLYPTADLTSQGWYKYHPQVSQGMVRKLESLTELVEVEEKMPV